MPYETVIYEKKNRIVYITLNRPQVLNALNDTLHQELIAALRDFDMDEEAWVAILSGKGRAFCSGADAKQRLLRPREELAKFGGPPSGVKPAGGFLGLGETTNWKPVIAAVHGYATGGGFLTTMECDLVVAAEDTKFQFSEVKRGIQAASMWAHAWFYGGGKFATEMALTARFFTAQEGHQMGLVNKVVPLDKLMTEAERMANEIIANPPLAVRCNVRVSRYYAQKMSEEARLYQWALKLALTEDAHEAALAFVEKRKPVFKGK